MSGHSGDDLAGVLYAGAGLTHLEREVVGGFCSVVTSDTLTVAGQFNLAIHAPSSQGGLPVKSTTTERQYWEDRSATFDRDSEYIVGTGLKDDITVWLQGQFSGTDAVLELGCGTGAFSEAVAPLVKELVVTDMSELMLDEARAKLGDHGNVRFQQEDAYEISLGDSTFDAVLLVNLLHVVNEPALVLSECSRVVRDGGKVVVADVTSQGTPLLAGMRLGLRYLRRWGRPPASSRDLKLPELVRLMQGAGFQVTDEALVGATVKAACLTGCKPHRPSPET